MNAVKEGMEGMKQSDAVKMARELAAQGKPYREIAQIVGAKGYLSPKTGKTLSTGGAYHLANRVRLKKGSAAKVQRRKIKDKGSTIQDLIKVICGLHQIDHETRLKLIGLVNEL